MIDSLDYRLKKSVLYAINCLAGPIKVIYICSKGLKGCGMRYSK